VVGLNLTLTPFLRYFVADNELQKLGGTYCLGYIAGTAATPRAAAQAAKVCAFDAPKGTGKDEYVRAFLDWASANMDRINVSAIEGISRALNARFPCGR
jgi:hypothetical protein